MAKYETKQRHMLLEYLEKNADRLITAEEAAEGIGGEKISVSAVYRNLSALEQEGRVQKSTIPGSRRTGFRYTGASDCRHKLHLTCKVCGKTCHASERTADSVAECLSGEDGFSIDREDTVLFGVCRDCKDE